MINNWKFGYKCIQYAHGRRSNGILMIIFLLISLLFFVMWPDTIFGGYMLMCASLMPTQMLSSLNVSSLVQSSPVRKKMQTLIPAVFTCGNVLIMYLISVLIHGITVLIKPETTGSVCISVILETAVMAIMMIYLAVAYKYFITSIAAFLIIYSILFSEADILKIDPGFFPPGSAAFPLTALSCLAILLAGGFLQYLFSLLVYKAPMSKMAQAASLREEL